MRDLISIVIPVYRVEKYLNKCIDSVLAQLYDNLEIILVDDGSDDNCPQICDQYACIDCRIKVIHKDNGGLSSARNSGIDIAKGKYICFIDSDDYIDENYVQKLYDALVLNNADISICAFSEMDEKGNQLDGNKRLPNTILDKEDLYRKNLVPDISWCMGVAWNKLYKIQLFDNVRYPEHKWHEDDFVSHHIYDNINKAVFIEDKLYYYVQHSGSITSNKRSLKHLDKIEAMQDRIEFALNTNRTYLIDRCDKVIVSILCTYIRIHNDTVKKTAGQYLNERKRFEQYCPFNFKRGFQLLVDNYFEWLLSVLGEIEKRCDISSYDTQHKRIYGYFAELLMNVYLMKKNLKKRCFKLVMPVDYMSPKAVRSKKKLDICSKVIDFFAVIHATELLYFIYRKVKKTSFDRFYCLS